MSIIAGWLSKIAISKILSYIKNNKREFILFAIVMFCFGIILFMTMRLIHRKKQVEKLNIQIERLEATNIFYQREIKDRDKEIKELNTYTNSLDKINKVIIYTMPKSDIEAYESISNDFMNTQEVN